jgi:uncharacterized protein YndB with AHSA1/START domain
MTVATTAAIKKSIFVRATPEVAFEVFTEGISRWWPLDRYGVFEDPAGSVTIGDEIVERASDGRTSTWGEVLALEPPSRAVFTWHPARAADDEPTEVEVTFVAEGDGTRVDLEHRGWERLGEERRAGRAGYDRGWDDVLGVYRTAADRA